MGTRTGFTRFSARKSGFLGIKIKTRLEFLKKSDLMMNLVVELRFGGGACGKRWGDGEMWV
jgi:hypothetical protein